MRITAAILLAAFTVSTSAQVGPSGQIGEVTLFGEEQLKVQAATKTEIPISKAPSAVTVITAKQISESGARTVPDLLRLVGGVNVRWNPMGPTVDVRGFGQNPFSNRILLLVDGTPMNSGDTGGLPLSPSFDFFPVQNIKRVEIVRGPGSALYGENAYWGVINIVTLSGEDLAGGNVELFGGSRDTGTVSAQYGLRLDWGSILGSVQLTRSAFPAEFWLENESKYKATEIFAKGTFKDFQLSVYRHEDELGGFSEPFPIPGLPPGSSFTSAHELTQTLEMVTLKYQRAREQAPITFSADLSWVHRKGMHCAGCHAAPQAPEFELEADHGYQAIGDFRAGLNMIPGHDVLVGLEARRLDRADHSHELSQGGDLVTGYDKLAYYVQDQFDVGSERLRAVVGLRYDAKTDIFDSKTSPRAALVYTPNEKLVVRGGYSTAFRFPTFSELFQETGFLTLTTPFGAIPLASFIPNPGLQPEEIRTFEAGAEYQISPTVSAKVDLYNSRVKNFMVIGLVQNPPPMPSGLQFMNAPAGATIRGGEVELRANFARSITGFANYAHQTQEGDETQTEFVYAPQNKINIGAYGGPFAGVRGAVEVSWRDSYFGPRFYYGLNGLEYAALDGYTFVNARVSYELPFSLGAKDRPVRVSLFGNNLLDERPQETLIGVDMTRPGREFFAQLEVDF